MRDTVFRAYLIFLGVILAVTSLAMWLTTPPANNLSGEWKCTAFVIKEEKECVRYEKRDYE